jgi:hypothetical protein
MTQLQDRLASLGACFDALTWVHYRTAQSAWDECESPDWMLWWAARTPANSRQQIVLVACACAELVLHLVPAGEDRPRQAIEAARLWAKNPTIENKSKVRIAAYAAHAAAYAAYAAYAAHAAAYAAHAAAYAAYAAADTAYAAADTAHAAADTAYAAADTAYAAARSDINKKMCGIIRDLLVLPWAEPKDI